jgi:hypothetical protein
MNTPMNQNPQDGSNSKSKNKWIALGVVGLLAVGGGAYLFTKHRSSQQSPSDPAPNGDAQTSSSGDAAVAGGAGSTTSGKTTGVAKGVAKDAKIVGAPSVPSTGSSATTAIAPAPAQVQVERDECLTITYHHKPSATHPDDESCSHHKNQLKLTPPAGKKIANNSICVRVNGTPVHFLTVKGHADELIFGSVAGPKSKVTVRYCTGQAKGCAIEKCEVPKDEFMEAIGGSDGKGQNANLGRWDPDAPAEKAIDVMAKLDGAVKRELETNDELNGRSPAGELFKDWIGEAQAQACGSAQAKN